MRAIQLFRGWLSAVGVRRSTSALAACLALLVALLAATPVHAVPPERTTFPISGTFVLAECDGFDVIDEYAGRATITQYYDDAGTVIRRTVHVNTQDRLTNSVTGFEEWTNNTYRSMLDLTTNIQFVRGMTWNITVPGYGYVYFDAGLGIFLREEDGGFTLLKFAGLLDLDEARLCAAMDQ